jgi:hypothetical protein
MSVPDLVWASTPVRAGIFGELEVFEATLPDGTRLRRYGPEGGSIYVEAAPGRWREARKILDSGKTGGQDRVVGPAVHYAFEFGDGRSKFNTHLVSDRKDPIVVEDLADDAGRKFWPDYVRLPDGREGPTVASLRAGGLKSYLALTGQAIRE